MGCHRHTLPGGSGFYRVMLGLYRDNGKMEITIYYSGCRV